MYVYVRSAHAAAAPPEQSVALQNGSEMESLAGSKFRASLYDLLCVCVLGNTFNPFLYSVFLGLVILLRLLHMV
jgi:hypothetical protein